MAVSIHESLVYPILSRLPPQSFQVNLKQWDPSAPPPGRNYYTSQDRVQFLIRGEPNEFLLPDRTFLNCSLSYQQNTDLSAVADPIGVANLNYATYLNRESKALAAVQHGPCWIGQVKESINGGGLEIFNHSDPAETPFYLAMRGLNSARNVQVDPSSKTKYVVDPGTVAAPSTQVYLEAPAQLNTSDAGALDGMRWENMEGCGMGSRAQRVNGCEGVLQYNDPAATPQFASNGYAGQAYSIPLTYISRIAQSASAVPLGLIGSYAAPSWRIEMTLANVGDVINSGAAFRGFDGADPANAGGLEGSRYEIRDLRISGVTVKIFDEGVMQSILALYSKAEVESVEGVPMPVSLTMPTLNQETNSYPLPQGTNQIKLLIPSTKHSVRGLFMMAIPEPNIGVTAGYNPADPKVARQGRYISSGAFHINYLQVKASGYCLQEAPQQEDQNSANGGVVLSMANRAWFAQAHSQAKHLYSAWSYHSERAVQNGQTGDSFSLFCGNGRGWFDDEVNQVLPYGISFENLPHADLYQGRTQSSGIDLSNIGRLEVTLRFGELAGDNVTKPVNGVDQSVGFTTVLGNLSKDYRLFTVLVYDEILEVSRAGVRDISDTVLAPPAIQ